MRASAEYRVLRKLAEGGMGRVDLVVKEKGTFRRVYAQKRLRDYFRDDPEVRDMFLDEGRIAGWIQHPNVVSVIDVGDDDDGPFLVMEFVRGMSAAELVESCIEQGDLLPVRLCTEIVIAVADGLHAAHEQKGEGGRHLAVVHRDVSPQNILIGFDGVARITDFGIARAIGRLSRTSTGMLKGKYGYHAPEQLRFAEPDRRADIFSLGVVFYELLAGRRAFKGEDAAESARMILEGPPPDIHEVRRDVPAAVEAVLFAMLARDPDARIGTAEEVARRLREALVHVEADDASSLAGYMSAHFAGARDGLDAQIDTLVTTPAPTASALPVTGTSSSASPSGARRIWLGVGALSLAAIALSGWLLVTREGGGASPATPDEAPETSVSAEEIVDPAGPAAHEALPEPEPASEQSAGVVGAPDPTSAPEAATERGGRSSMRRRARRAMRPGMRPTVRDEGGEMGSPATEGLAGWQ